MTRALRHLAIPPLMLATALSGCAGRDKPLGVAPAGPSPAAAYRPTQAAPALASVAMVTALNPRPLGAQAKRVTRVRKPVRESGLPTTRVNAANAAARIEPVRDGFVNAVQLYPYSAGALYQVYTAPGHVTDIALEAGEQLVGTGPVAAGDTTRWIIGDTTSGSGAGMRVHILVKPTRTDLATNLVINTDRRTYLLELTATPSTWLASVSWTYPTKPLVAPRRFASPANPGPLVFGISADQPRYGYRIRGDRPSWRPVRAFDDGRHVYIEFPPGIAQGEMPPLFVLGAGGAAELVNYRVHGRHMIVDRLFGAAELRLGAKRQQRVRIEPISRSK